MNSMLEKIRTLFSDKKRTREIALYVLFGVLTTLVSWAVYLAFTRLMGIGKMEEGSGRYVLVSNLGQVISWIAAVLFAYFTNKKYVFQSKAGAKDGAWREFWLFVSARVASLLIFDLLLFNVCLMLGMDDRVDKLLMNVLVVIFNYAASKWVIFKKKKEEKET